MSEYQYYEFLAVDRPLDEADRQALRALSTRATITATRFVNSYEWGGFKGDPAKLMERWFDLHLYLANWGTRRLMLRLPKRFIDLVALGRFLDDVDGVTVRSAGDNLVFDMLCENEDALDEDWDTWLSALSPLRADVMGGDLRLFYLLWLTAVEAGSVDDDAPEPLPRIGQLTASLKAFADFFRIDPDFVRAATERDGADVQKKDVGLSAEAAIAALPDRDKTALLVKFFLVDPHAGAELQLLLRRQMQPEEVAAGQPASQAMRTAGVLRIRAETPRRDRAHAEAQAAVEQARQRTEEAEKQRRTRLYALAKKGEAVWREIETEINRRNASGYAKAVGLLSDLKALAAGRDLAGDFNRRLAAVRERHLQKTRFIERLTDAGL